MKRKYLAEIDVANNELFNFSFNRNAHGFYFEESDGFNNVSQR